MPRKRSTRSPTGVRLLSRLEALQRAEAILASLSIDPSGRYTADYIKQEGGQEWVEQTHATIDDMWHQAIGRQVRADMRKGRR